MKLGIVFTQETAKLGSPRLVYIDILALFYLLYALTMCCVVALVTLYY